MTRQITDMDVQAALREVAAFVHVLDTNCRTAEAAKYDPSLHATMEAFIRHHLSSGQILTPALQLPPGWRPIVMAMLNGDGRAWSNRHPRLEVRLRNTSDRPVSLVYEIEEVIQYDRATGMPSQTSDNVPIMQTVEPNETIDLDAERAVQALHQYCRKACHPSMWMNWSHAEVDPKTAARVDSNGNPNPSLIQTDYIEEVAFRARLRDTGRKTEDGKPIAGWVESAEWSKKRVK